MKTIFKKTPPTENFTYRLTYKGIEVGIFPVMFGFRVRAGFIGDSWCAIDWCCGANETTVRVYLQLLIEILEYRIANNLYQENIFEDMPSASHIKPLINDIPFLEEILKLPRQEVDPIYPTDYRLT